MFCCPLCNCKLVFSSRSSIRFGFDFFFFFGKTMPVEVVQLSAFVMLAAIDCFVLRA